MITQADIDALGPFTRKQQHSLGTRRVRNGMPQVYCKAAVAAPAHEQSQRAAEQP